MIRLTHKLLAPMSTSVGITLTLDQRQRRRLRAVLDDGREAGIFLDRADGLRAGDCLGSSSPALAIASGLHETQYTRLFRS